MEKAIALDDPSCVLSIDELGPHWLFGGIEGPV
jgi:hypothetical protein